VGVVGKLARTASKNFQAYFPHMVGAIPFFEREMRNDDDGLFLQRITMIDNLLLKKMRK
jgi:hypothetical protein